MAENEKAKCKCGNTYTVWRRNGIKTSSKCPKCTMSDMFEKAKKRESKKTPKGKAKKSISNVSSKKGLDKKLDDAWSLAIKIKAGFKCEYCGKTTTLNSHHITTRGKKSVRWSLNNGICLCVAHHTFSSEFSAHKTSLLFIPWLIKYRGQDNMDLLASQARSYGKYSEFEKEIMLEELNKFIKENR